MEDAETDVGGIVVQPVLQEGQNEKCVIKRTKKQSINQLWMFEILFRITSNLGGTTLAYNAELFFKCGECGMRKYGRRIGMWMRNHWITCEMKFINILK